MIFNRKEKDEGASVIDKVTSAFKYIGTSLHDIHKRVSKVGFSVSLEDLQDNYATALDMLIIKEEETKNCQYVGGEFRIALIGDGKYDCAYDFYFEDENGSFHELSAHTEPLPLDGLTDDFRKELEDEKVLCFDLGEPSEESRQKYREQKEQATEQVEAEDEIVTALESKEKTETATKMEKETEVEGRVNLTKEK